MSSGQNNINIDMKMVSYIIVLILFFYTDEMKSLVTNFKNGNRYAFSINRTINQSVFFAENNNQFPCQ